MSTPDHPGILLQGVEAWNAFRRENPFIVPNLISADLRKASLEGADLRRAAMSGADLHGTHCRGAMLTNAHLNGTRLVGADLSGADLEGASCIGADFRGARLCGAHLTNAYLFEAQLSWANLSNADLRGANLTQATLVRTNLSGAVLDGCSVYGVSTWDVDLDGASQRNLRLESHRQDLIMVDDLEIAQLIYLMLNNANIRKLFNTLTMKAVLVLGRFAGARKAVLDGLRNELRRCGYLPIVFDFKRPADRSLTETITALALMSHFILADLTDARSVPQELYAIVPHLPSVPLQPLMEAGSRQYALFEHFERYPWVRQTYVYDDLHALLANLRDAVLQPLEESLAG